MNRFGPILGTYFTLLKLVFTIIFKTMIFLGAKLLNLLGTLMKIIGEGLEKIPTPNY